MLMGHKSLSGRDQEVLAEQRHTENTTECNESLLSPGHIGSAHADCVHLLSVSVFISHRN